MEIRARCKYDIDSYKALTHLWMFKKANPQRRFITWAVVWAFLVLFILVEMIIHSDEKLTVLLCVAIAVFALECYLYFLLPKIQYKALGKMKDTEFEYIFCDDILRINSKNERHNGEAEIEYSLFSRVYETSRYFFLYQTNNQVFLVDKSTVEGGTAEHIRSKLSAWVKDRYIICKY